MKEKQYPVGLPARTDDGIGIISTAENGMYRIMFENGEKLYYHSESKITPLTEAEYFAEVMKPLGWNVTGNEQYFVNEDAELFIHRSPNYTAEHKYHIKAFTRHMLETISEALDYSEALQAIRKYEQS